MLRASNGIVGALNLVTLLVACSALGYSLWLNQRSKSTCKKTLHTPLLAASAALLVVSAAGIIGSCCSVSFFMWLYLVMLFVLIIVLTAFTIFGVIVTHGRIGEALAEKQPEDRPRWLQRHVMDEENWEKIRACLADVKFCGGIEAGKSEEYYRRDLSPVQLRCCTPPSNCPMDPAAGAAMPGRGLKEVNPDCMRWSSNQTQLCFSCKTCKTTVVKQIRRKWWMLAAINACLVALVAVVYFISCCAMRNIQKYGYTRFRNYDSP